MSRRGRWRFLLKEPPIFYTSGKNKRSLVVASGIFFFPMRRATKISWSYKDLSYEERLKRFGLTTLESKRSRLRLN